MSGRDVLGQVTAALGEMCWCGHDYHHHTDSDTPFCAYPLFPEEDGFWDTYPDGKECACDDWYPMDEDPPERD